MNDKNNSELKVIGISGTRGKTIVAHILYDLLYSSGIRVSLLSTNGIVINGVSQNDAANSYNINKKTLKNFFRDSNKEECQYAIVEISSQKIKDGTFNGVELSHAILTNIHEDSLEIHGTLNEYIHTKIEFVKLIKDGGALIVDSSDKNSKSIIRENKDKIENNIYVINANRSIIAREEHFIDGTRFYIDELGEVITRLSGDFNIGNIILAVMLARFLTNPKTLIPSLRKAEPILGRLHLYRKTPANIFVDYAKKPGTLKASLEHLTKVKSPKSRIISVFGASGDKDKLGRESGNVLKDLSDYVILTSQDPNFEDVSKINSEIHTSSGDYGSVLIERIGSEQEYELIKYDNLANKIERVYLTGDVPFIAFDENAYTSRLNAIDLALKISRPGDIIYITGKGHEKSSIYNNIEYEWSDYEAINLLLSQYGYQ
ncbi:MAG: Mur ligase family protein [Candidatus Dojkabacteria bacterium]|nr:Mur ligase family protein [Candidatus Dojkabacteria bacterium]